MSFLGETFLLLYSKGIHFCVLMEIFVYERVQCRIDVQFNVFDILAFSPFKYNVLHVFLSKGKISLYLYNLLMPLFVQVLISLVTAESLNTCY